MQEETEFVHIAQRSNGLIVQERKIQVDQLLAAMMETMEPIDLLNLLLDNDEMINEALGEWIEEQEAEKVNKFFTLLLSRVEVDYEFKQLVELFQEISKRFDLSQLDEGSLNNLLKLLLDQTKKLENAEVFNALFITLLQKLSISDPTSQGRFITKILEETLSRVKKEEDIPLIEAMFFELAKKSRKDWVRKVLAPYTRKKKVYQTPILPKNCVLFQEELDGKKIVVIEVERQQINVDYHRSSFENVGHPKLWFEFEVMSDRIVSCRVFALKDPVVKPTSKIYHYPFSNVFQDFRTCWPDLWSLEIQDIYQLSTLPMLFLRSPSNDHLFRGKNLRELFASLQNRDFDDTLLEDSGKTVAAFFGLK